MRPAWRLWLDPAVSLVQERGRLWAPVGEVLSRFGRAKEETRVRGGRWIGEVLYAPIEAVAEALGFGIAREEEHQVVYFTERAKGKGHEAEG